MKRRQKTRLLLTAFTAAVLLGVYLWMVFQEHRAENGEDGLRVYTMEAAAIDRLAFTGEEGPVTLVRRGEQWFWQQEEAFPLNQNFTKTMVDKTAVLEARAVVAEGKEHYRTYGLDQPSNVITVGAGGQEKIIYLGSSSSASGDFYMAVEESEKIYVVDASFHNIFSGSILSMAVRESLPDFHLEDITRLTVAEGEREITFSRESEKGTEPGEASGNAGWMVFEKTGEQPDGNRPAGDFRAEPGEPCQAEPPDGNRPAGDFQPEPPELRQADQAQVTGLLAQVMKLRFEELAVYQPDARELDACGLGEPAVRLLVVYKKEGQERTYSILVGNGAGSGSHGNAGDGTQRNAGTESRTSDYCYVYPEGGYGIYLTRADSLAPFRGLAAEAFLSLSVGRVRREELGSIAVSAGEVRTEYTLEAQADGRVAFYHDGKEITEKEFNGIYYPLYSLTAEKRVTDITSQLTQPPALTLEYRRLPGYGEPVRVELIAYDQNYYGAKVNGKAELLVNRQQVHRLMELWK